MTSLSQFDALLCKAAAHATSLQGPDADDSNCSVFVVSEVINSSGGRTGCFLYRGRLVTPAPRSDTPDCWPWPRSPAAGGDGEEQRLVPQLGDLDDEDEQPNWAELEGQDLTLYMSYEEASPKMKQRVAAARGPGAAPWRAMLRDGEDNMVFCLRGLPLRLQVDEGAALVTWGPSVAVAFPTAEAARVFAKGVCQVEVQQCCLAGTPQHALLQAHAAEQRLAGAAVAPANKAVAAAAAPPAADCAHRSSYPRSPDLMAAMPRVGCKRPAQEPLPASLLTPIAKPRLLSSAALITPTCAAELLA